MDFNNSLKLMWLVEYKFFEVTLLKNIGGADFEKKC